MCDSKTVFRFPAGSVLDRAIEILGKTVAADLFPLDMEDNGVRLHGFLGSPAVSRSTPSHLYTYINGRYIRDRVVQHAILQSYRNVLERGRYPVLVLFITISAEEVDVNVHPTKHEVRFREQGKIHAVIQNGIEQLLRTAPWIAKGTVPFRQQSVSHPSSPSMSKVEEVKESLLRYAVRQENLPLPRPAQFQRAFERPAIHETAVDLPTETPGEAAISQSTYFSDLNVIGQYRAAYIVCQDGADLLLIDQHAAHERVVFEELRNRIQSGSLEGQQLLFPETVDLSPVESSVIREYEDDVQKLAFDLENFGGNTWLLKGIPLLLAGLDYRQALRDILEELCGLGRSGRFADLVDDILARIACHSVVRGQHQLSMPEIQKLLQRMDGTDFAANCPHGRPVVARISNRDIEKMFKRV